MILSAHLSRAYTFTFFFFIFLPMFVILFLTNTLKNCTISSYNDNNGKEGQRQWCGGASNRSNNIRLCAVRELIAQLCCVMSGGTWEDADLRL